MSYVEMLGLCERAQRAVEEHFEDPDDDAAEELIDALDALRQSLLPLAYPIRIPDWPPECPCCDQRMRLQHLGLQHLGQWFLVCEPCGIAAPSADAA